MFYLSVVPFNYIDRLYYVRVSSDDDIHPMAVEHLFPSPLLG